MFALVRKASYTQLTYLALLRVQRGACIGHARAGVRRWRVCSSEIIAFDLPNCTSTDPVSLWAVASACSLSSHLLSHIQARHRLLPLTVGLSGVVTLGDDEVLRPVVVLAGEVGLEDSLGAGGVALLGVDRGTGHVRNHGVSAAPGAVACVAERVVLRCWLGEPDVTTVAAEVAVLESLGNILLDDDGATGGVDEP